MCESFQEPKNGSIGVDKTVSLFDFNDLGHNSCPANVPLSAAGPNKGIPVEKFSPDNIETRSTSSRGTIMVDKQYQLVKRQINNSATTTNNCSDEYIKKRMGAFTNDLKTGGVCSSMKKTQRINI